LDLQKIEEHLLLCIVVLFGRFNQFIASIAMGIDALAFCQLHLIVPHCTLTGTPPPTPGYSLNSSVVIIRPAFYMALMKLEALMLGIRRGIEGCVWISILALPM